MMHGGIRCVVACALLCPAGAADQLPGTRLLTTARMELQVMDPAAPDRYNRGVRFTPLAAVLRGRVDGHDYLYAPAGHDPLADHGGLAAEFDLCTPGGPVDDLPPGWSNAAVGGGFLKIGVGVLEKSSEPYHLFQQPRVLVPAITEVVWGPAAAHFRQTCAGMSGYAYELWADLTAGDALVTITWRLANRGIRPFTTRQYSHNFLRFDDADVGPDYALSFPYDITVSGLEPEQEAGTREIRFLRPIPRWANLAIPWPPTYDGPNDLTLTHRGSGLALTCTTSVPGLRTAVHARRGYCAPEQFIAVTLAPDATMQWTRTYRFH